MCYCITIDNKYIYSAKQVMSRMLACQPADQKVIQKSVYFAEVMHINIWL